MTLLALVDTSVLVGGLLADDPTSAARRVVDAMESGRLRFVLSEKLLREYRSVLLREEVTCCHGLTEAQVDAVLEAIVLESSWRPSAHPHSHPHPDADADPDPTGHTAAAQKAPQPAPPAVRLLAPPSQEHLISLLEAEPTATLVTEDDMLREAVHGWRSSLTPAELVALLQPAPPPAAG